MYNLFLYFYFNSNFNICIYNIQNKNNLKLKCISSFLLYFLIHPSFWFAFKQSFVLQIKTSRGKIIFNHHVGPKISSYSDHIESTVR